MSWAKLGIQEVWVSKQYRKMVANKLDDDIANRNNNYPSWSFVADNQSTSTKFKLKRRKKRF
jgi:hypothetical protein